MAPLVKAVILDIEGTVAPISFVKDILFPYFLSQLPSVLSNVSFPLESNSNDPIIEILSSFPTEHNDTKDNLESYINSLVEQDIKDATLKALQGFVWLKGYESGVIKSPVYPDSIEALKKWSASGKNVYIYSSGSIKAQKLLFGYVDVGEEESVDLNEFLSGYYDITTSGYKQERESYEKIVKSIGDVEPQECLFLSDNEKEVQAALEAGLQSIVVIRPGNAALEKDFQTIHNFEELSNI